MQVASSNSSNLLEKAEKAAELMQSLQTTGLSHAVVFSRELAEIQRRQLSKGVMRFDDSLELKR
jgi:ATP-dependent Clp protease adapter protein ClpS